MNWNWENGEKPNFGANFELLGPKLGSHFFFFVGFTSTLLDVRHKLDMSQAIIVCNFKENIWSKLKKMTKTSLWAWFRPIRPKKYLDLSVTRYGQLSSFKISEKTKDPISRKFCDGKRDGWTDRETKRRKWFYRTLSEWLRAPKRLKQGILATVWSF